MGTIKDKTSEFKKIESYYDENAGIYNVRHGLEFEGQRYNFEKYYRPFLKRVIPKEGRVLELGCGTGVYTKWLHDQGLDVTAMDISGEMVKQAKACCSDARFYQGNCEEPASVLGESVASEGFDAIIGLNTFSYYLHKRDALANYAKLLRPGGRFILIDMNGACPFYQWMAWLNKNEMREWLPAIAESRKSVLSSLLHETGYSIETLEHFAFIPNGLSKGKVSLLKPVDGFFHAAPFLRQYAMRIALSARLKKG